MNLGTLPAQPIVRTTILALAPASGRHRAVPPRSDGVARMALQNAVSVLLAALVWLLLARATPAQAAGVVSDCSMLGLAAVMNSGNGDISFSCGLATIPFTISAGLSVKNGHFFKIDGGNLITLTGVGANRIFNVQAGGALTLTNLILSDGSAGSTSVFQNYGGALLNTGGTLVLNQVTVRNSTANEGGGAIENMTGTTSVLDSLLANNSAGHGGAIDSAGALLISHTLVTSNTISGGNGGGLWTSAPSALVVNSSFRNNRAFIGPLFDPLAGHGGAIYNLGTLSVTNSTLDYNFANQGGGGLWNDTGATALVSVEVSVNSVSPTCNIFGTCSGPGNGGGIGNAGGSVTLDRSRLESNQVFTGTGGAIYNTGSLSLLNFSTLYGNAALNGGGGIYSTNRLTISESFLTANYIGCFPCVPVAGSGGALFLSGSAVITNSLFQNNQSTADGGAIRNEGTLDVSLTDFDANSAPGRGGGIENLGTVTVVDSSFEYNNMALRGGAMDNNQGTLNLLSTTFYSNSARIGGALTNDLGTLTMTNSTLDHNSAKVGGGMLNNGGLWMTNTVVTNNTAKDNASAADGGGLWLTGTVAVQNSTISGNAADNGGGINMQGYGFLLNLTLRGNTGITNGGGIYVAMGSASTLDGATISGNTANFGGGIYSASAPGFNRSFQHLNISGNYSNCWGGGIYHYVGDLTLLNITVNGNTAFCRGGGIYNFGGKMTLLNVTVSGNAAGSRGGGIAQEDRASLLNVTLSNNSATQGGALWMPGGTTTYLTNTIVAYSSAGGNCVGSPASSLYSISSDVTCALAGTVKGLNPNGLDPLLTALGDYGGAGPLHLLVHLPKAGSPAIDGVLGSGALPYDERDFPRPQGSGYDIGAVEGQPSDVDTIPKLWLPLVER